MFFKPQHIHFVGIGGIGMSGIAEVLLNLGYTISGSDLRASAITERLRTLGARVFVGHQAQHIDGAKVVVVSSAVDPTNPEYQESRARGIPVIPRGELLAELMRLKFGVAIAGSHGKTTTTSMVATILSQAELDPTVVVGGRVRTFAGSNARVGKSDFLVVESDESDRSFLKLAPILAVVTNIDMEHLDHYSSLDDIQGAFVQFINKVPFYGAAILCLDDANVQQILPRVERRVITYGVSAQADVRLVSWEFQGLGSRFRLSSRGADLGEFRLCVPGFHNILNATAAVATAKELEVDLERIREGVAAYEGVDRRFQVKGEVQGVTVIDDYAHHPTEIRATLDALRQAGYGRILVLFQPHRYSRTQQLMDDFAGAFNLAHEVWVTAIYAASEAAIPGITSQRLVERMREFGHRGTRTVDDLQSAVDAMVSQAMPGDALVTMGAGNVSQASDLLVDGLRRRASDGASPSP
ncbi:MAG: UDP-N-acetylmuramate--L-alanine ligase [Bryobacterales bacterium]|jgi:UDP-N-acetylmuramate--alanine ligase|nr:UDP-N-acetylmuramate--L-alanine ligase [Bryobacterales bacterium]